MISNKKLSIGFFLLILVAIVVTGCASAVKAEQPHSTEPTKENTPTDPVTASHGNKIGGYTDLVDALRETGADVEPVQEIQQPFFDAHGQIIKLNDADVQVFEFVDEDARKVASDQISPDGSSTGTTMITWMDQPNFWAKGQVIALYVGKDTATIDLLTTVMGKPITSHE